MKVLLTQDMERLGRMGEVVKVAGGYASNYLIPRGLAVGVTRGRLKEIREQQRVLEVKAARLRESFEAKAEGLRSKRVVIKTRCSASGKLFGSVTSRQLAEELSGAAGFEIDRHKIVVDDKIRSVGAYTARVKLHPDVVVDLEFDVEGDGFVAEEPPDEEALASTEGPEGETEEKPLEAPPATEAGEAAAGEEARNETGEQE